MTAPLDKRECKVCGQMIPVTREWTFFVHYDQYERNKCPGSHESPPRPTAKRNTHGSRWR